MKYESSFGCIFGSSLLFFYQVCFFLLCQYIEFIWWWPTFRCMHSLAVCMHLKSHTNFNRLKTIKSICITRLLPFKDAWFSLSHLFVFFFWFNWNDRSKKRQKYQKASSKFDSLIFNKFSSFFFSLIFVLNAVASAFSVVAAWFLLTCVSY